MTLTDGFNTSTVVSIDLSRKHAAVETHSEGHKTVVPVDDKLVPPQKKVVVSQHD